MVRRPEVRIAAKANTTMRANTRFEKPTAKGSITRRAGLGILAMRASLLLGKGSLVDHQFQQRSSFLLIPIKHVWPQKRAEVELRAWTTAAPARRRLRRGMPSILRPSRAAVRFGPTTTSRRDGIRRAPGPPGRAGDGS